MKHTDLEALLEQICTALNIGVKRAKSRGANIAIDDARTIFAFRAFKMGATDAQIGKAINRKAKTINDLIDSYLLKLRDEPMFRKKADLTEVRRKEAA